MSHCSFPGSVLQDAIECTNMIDSLHPTPLPRQSKDIYFLLASMVLTWSNISHFWPNSRSNYELKSWVRPTECKLPFLSAYEGSQHRPICCRKRHSYVV